jgi:hypothetical protein
VDIIHTEFILNVRPLEAVGGNPQREIIICFTTWGTIHVNEGIYECTKILVINMDCTALMSIRRWKTVVQPQGCQNNPQWEIILCYRGACITLIHNRRHMGRQIRSCECGVYFSSQEHQTYMTVILFSHWRLKGNPQEIIIRSVLLRNSRLRSNVFSHNMAKTHEGEEAEQVGRKAGRMAGKPAGRWACRLTGG